MISVLSLLSDSGLSSYVVRARSIDERMLSTAFWTTNLISFALAGALAACSKVLAGAFDQPALTTVLLWLSLSLVLSGLSGVPTSLMRRRMQFKQLAGRSMVATLVSSVLAIVLALAGAGVWALVAQVLARAAVSTIVLWRVVDWSPTFAWDRRQAAAMLSFGSKLLGVNMMVQARDRGQDFMFAGVLGTASLGLWSVANRLLRTVTESCSSVISSVATPAFSRMQDDKLRLFRAYELAMSVSGSLLFPAMIFLSVSSPQLVPLVLGEQWTTSAQLAQISSLTAAITAFSYFDRPIFIALGKVGAEFRLVAMSVALQLGTVAIFISSGLMAVAIALLVRGAVVVPIRFITLHRVTGMPFGVLLRPLRVFAAAIVMGGIALVVSLQMEGVPPWLDVMLVAGACAVTYPLLLWLLARPVVREIFAEIRHMRSREPAVPLGESVPASAMSAS